MPLHQEPILENVVAQTQCMESEPQIEIQDEILGGEMASEQKEESIKERLKQDPKQAVILSEILSPKFKQYN